MTRKLRAASHESAAALVRLVKGAVLAVVGIAFAGTSCVPAAQQTSNAPVILRIVSIDPSPLQSDVVSADSVVAADIVIVSVANRAKNPSVTTPQVNMAVFMERYTVNYTRSDGRSEVGVDVPSPISGGINGVVDVADGGDILGIALEAVRIQQKLEPPLRNLRRDPGDTSTTGGGAIVVTMNAEICVYGRTTVEQVVSDCASLQIDFGDFAIPDVP